MAIIFIVDNDYAHQRYLMAVDEFRMTESLQQSLFFNFYVSNINFRSESSDSASPVFFWTHYYIDLFIYY